MIIYRRLIIGFLCSWLVLATSTAYATHIAGGELFYRFLNAVDGNTDRYQFTMRLYRECTSGGQQLAGESVTIGIYSKANNALIAQIPLSPNQTGITILRNTPGAIPCLTNNIDVCYQIGEWEGAVDLPKNNEGYYASWVRYTRTDMLNVTGGFVGATFLADIPGRALISNGTNNSARFVVRDTAIICRDKNFSIDYSASDADGDSLAYKFVAALDGQGGSGSNPNPIPQTSITTLLQPPLTYSGNFSGNQPLGSLVIINPRTGIISGRAPGIPGKYVLCVAAEEWRNGVKIAESRKDFIITIGDCDFAEANLNPNTRAFCESFTYNFENGSTSSSIQGYLWDFGVPLSPLNNSSLATPSFTFPDTGIYKVKLTVFGPNGCNATDSLELGIFPGFTARANIVGTCFLNPYQFRDSSITAYGSLNSFRWDFGNLFATNDTSRLRIANYTYPSAGTYTVQYIVGNTKGCVDTADVVLTVRDRPQISLPFKDTLICNVDTLPLVVNTNAGVVSWQPNINIINPNSSNPLVFPRDSIQYIVTVNDDGCISRDTVRVNVLPFISVSLPPDTTICKTDSIVLRTVSEGLRYTWSPSTGLSSDVVKQPKAAPLVRTTYRVIANLGDFCIDTAFITVQPVPYPQVDATGSDTLCFGQQTQIVATMDGTSFTWSPIDGLINANTLTPIARPNRSMQYIIQVNDVLGCPKPSFDTVFVRVIPEVLAFAGNDTSVVVGQPLQLNAYGGTNFQWSPSIGLSSTSIANPIANYTGNVDSVRYIVRVSTPEGCSDTTDIKVRIFKTGPDIFVPSGFTPNADGRNDVLRPVPVGIKQLVYFRVYNRLGELVYTTNTIGQGWDGVYKGVKQASGTFVYTAEGIDFQDKTVVRNGTAVLIR